jgi:hypothetical protein
LKDGDMFRTCKEKKPGGQVSKGRKIIQYVYLFVEEDETGNKHQLHSYRTELLKLQLFLLAH